MPLGVRRRKPAIRRRKTSRVSATAGARQVSPPAAAALPPACPPMASDRQMRRIADVPDSRGRYRRRDRLVPTDPPRGPSATSKAESSNRKALPCPLAVEAARGAFLERACSEVARRHARRARDRHGAVDLTYDMFWSMYGGNVEWLYVRPNIADAESWQPSLRRSLRRYAPPEGSSCAEEGTGTWKPLLIESETRD